MHFDNSDAEPFRESDAAFNEASCLLPNLDPSVPVDVPPSPRTLARLGVYTSADMELEQSVLEEIAEINSCGSSSNAGRIHEGLSGDVSAAAVTPNAPAILAAIGSPTPRTLGLGHHGPIAASGPKTASQPCRPEMAPEA